MIQTCTPFPGAGLTFCDHQWLHAGLRHYGVVSAAPDKWEQYRSLGAQMDPTLGVRTHSCTAPVFQGWYPSTGGTLKLNGEWVPLGVEGDRLGDNPWMDYISSG
jgi:hypothetical protein